MLFYKVGRKQWRIFHSSLVTYSKSLLCVLNTAFQGLTGRFFSLVKLIENFEFYSCFYHVFQIKHLELWSCSPVLVIFFKNATKFIWMILNTPCYTLWLKIPNNYKNTDDNEKLLNSVELSMIWLQNSRTYYVRQQILFYSVRIQDFPKIRKSIQKRWFFTRWTFLILDLGTQW